MFFSNIWDLYRETYLNEYRRGLFQHMIRVDRKSEFFGNPHPKQLSFHRLGTHQLSISNLEKRKEDQ